MALNSANFEEASGRPCGAISSALTIAKQLLTLGGEVVSWSSQFHSSFNLLRSRALVNLRHVYLLFGPRIIHMSTSAFAASLFRIGADSSAAALLDDGTAPCGSPF